MGSELLNIIEGIARDKGIDKEILIKAVENSLASAAKKSSETISNREHIVVQIDRKTGSIKALAELKVIEDSKKPTLDEIRLSDAKKVNPDININETVNVDLTPADFGRIVAQSAKQIIIQKIREAERGIIYDEFKDRIGDIIMGTIRRKEKGNIIIDLGRAEAVMPLKEQCPEERYHIGNRIRTYISEVKITPRGPEIVLSRTHIGLIKRLFELEIPEITDGTVDIKGIVREPGIRCKVAVYSSDPKVDPIGACVGMRGNRIKNIVRELEDEKLDIIKWERDIKDYVINALSPAKVESVIVNEQGKKLEVRVAEDQLSVAIGKRGQNVRLASKLTGWDIDIRKIGEPEEKAQQETTAEISASEIQPEEPKTVEQTQEEGPSIVEPVSTIHDLEKLEISQKKMDELVKAGLDSIERIANADISQLLRLTGFGEKTAAKIKEKAQNLIKNNHENMKI